MGKKRGLLYAVILCNPPPPGRTRVAVENVPVLDYSLFGQASNEDFNPRARLNTPDITHNSPLVLHVPYKYRVLPLGHILGRTS